MAREQSNDLLERYRAMKSKRPIEDEEVTREYDPNPLIKSFANASRSFGEVGRDPNAGRMLNESLDRDSAIKEQDYLRKLGEQKQDKMLRSKELLSSIDNGIKKDTYEQRQEQKRLNDEIKRKQKLEDAKELLSHRESLKKTKEKEYKLPQSSVKELEGIDAFSNSSNEILEKLKDKIGSRGFLDKLKNRVTGDRELEQLKNDMSKLYNKIFDPTTGVSDAEAASVGQAYKESLLDIDNGNALQGIERMKKSINSLKDNKFRSFYKSQAAQGGEQEGKKFIEGFYGKDYTRLLNPDISKPLSEDVQKQGVQEKEGKKEASGVGVSSGEPVRPGDLPSGAVWNPKLKGWVKDGELYEL